MRVTFCGFDRPNYAGGPNVWLQRKLPQLATLGIEPHVLFMLLGEGPERDYFTMQALRRQGIECTAIPWPQDTEKEVHWILESLARTPPDAFVPNLVVSAYYAARWVRESGIPTIGVMHSDQSFYQGLVEEFVVGPPEYRVSAVVCVSKYLEESLRMRDGTALVRWIPTGTPIPAVVANPPSGRLRLVYVGRLLEHAKRITELTKALCRAAREVPGTEAVIIGDGPSRPAVDQILRTEGRGLPVTLAGLVDSGLVQQHLLTCHVAVLLSDYEGLPLSLMEAMACGLPPIALRTRSGIPELVEHEVTGLLVDDRGDGFVSAVRRLREDADLWRRLSQGARARAIRDYSVEVAAARWRDLVVELTPGGTAGVRRPVPMPQTLTLPSVNARLAREDHRSPVSTGIRPA